MPVGSHATPTRGPILRQSEGTPERSEKSAGPDPSPDGAQHQEAQHRDHDGEAADPVHPRPNGHAHCKHALIGSASQTIPIIDGELQLGQWQRVFFIELDRARDRKVFIQVLGE